MSRVLSIVAIVGIVAVGCWVWVAAPLSQPGLNIRKARYAAVAQDTRCIADAVLAYMARTGFAPRTVEACLQRDPVATAEFRRPSGMEYSVVNLPYGTAVLYEPNIRGARVSFPSSVDEMEVHGSRLVRRADGSETRLLQVELAPDNVLRETNEILSNVVDGLVIRRRPSRAFLHR
jgi:hypothetical protein